MSEETNAKQGFKSLYPEVKSPYYIVAPPYVRTSAGVRVLHLLCHSLNRMGQTAYVLLYPALPWQKRQVAPDLLTPVVTPGIVRSHFERGMAPILVYPEICSGNPFGGPCVVRYVLNFPGLLGGDKDYASDELVYSYSKVLAQHTQSPDNVLFLPATDTRLFRMADNQPERRGSCFYAHKYKNSYGGHLFDVTSNSFEITANDKNSLGAPEIAALFQRSEVFYAYENTALATEAVLCGCPTVFLPNPYLQDIIAIRELGPEGYAWGTDPAAVARARETVAQGAQNYLKTFDAFWRDLENFIRVTQEHAAAVSYKAPVRLPNIGDAIRYVFRERGGWNRRGAIWGWLRRRLTSNE